MNFDMLMQFFFSGLTYGSIYAIIAIGFNIIYNSTGIINFAQGEFVMLGGMITYSFTQFLPLPFAILLAVLITTMIGSLIELIFIRSLTKNGPLQINIIIAGCVLLIDAIIFQSIGNAPLLFAIVTIASIILTLAVFNYCWFFVKDFKKRFQITHKPNVLQMIIITIGLSIVIRAIALQVWGEQVKTVPFFTGNEVSSMSFLGAHFSPQILWVLAIAALIVICLSLFFKFTLTGQAMLGCSANREGASLCGINPQSMVNLSFMLSAGIGALAGCAVSPLTQTHYDIGAELAIKGFTVAIFGGLGNSLGAVAAGLLLGIIEAFTVIFFPEAYKDIVTIGLLLVILFIKPSGLFGSKSASALKEF